MQCFHVIAKRGKHAFHLVVFSLGNAEQNRLIIKYLEGCGQTGMLFTFKPDAIGKSLLIVWANWSGKLNAIDFLTVAAGRSQAMIPLAIIGDQQQACGIDIETACDLKLCAAVFINQIQRSGVAVVAGCRYHSRGLVEHKVTVRCLADNRAINADFFVT